MSICIAAAWKCFIGGAVLKMKMMKLAVTIISLFLIGLAFYPTQRAEAGLPEQALSALKTLVKFLYSLASTLFPFISVFINTAGALIAGLFATSPEFFSGFLAGFIVMVLMGYVLFGILFPHSWFCMLILFLFGFPICIFDPIFVISLFFSIPIGVIVGLILGILSLSNIKTPAEQANIPLGALATGTVRREGGKWVIYPPAGG